MFGGRGNCRRGGGGVVGRRYLRLKKLANRPVVNVIVLETLTKKLTLEELAQIRIIRLVVGILLRADIIEILRERFGQAGA